MRMKPVLVATILLLVSSTLAGVKVNFEKTADFGRYRTYAWGEGTPAARAKYQEWIVAAITQELRDSGLRLATDEEPDLLVVTVAFAHLSAATRGNYIHLDKWNVGIISSDAVGGGTGHLAVDLVDRAADKVVWRAVAEESFMDDPPQRKIAKIVSKMFRKYPPR